MSLSVGDEAPAFTLDGVDGTTGEAVTVSLDEHLGQVVVLVFYPADNSPVCTKQLESYTREIGEFGDVDAKVLAISPQSPESHRQFAADRGGFGFPVLSDEDRGVGESYGVLGLLDLYRRCTFVVDAKGRIAWLHRYVGPGMGFRSVEDVVAAVKAST